MQSVFKPRRNEIESRVQALAKEKNYPLEITSSQRTLGPRPNELVPSHGTEVYVNRLPREVFEDQLFPLFETAGPIYKFRLMMSPSGISTRGAAFITYHNEETAKNAIDVFNNLEIVPGHWIDVKKSIDNRRLFIGGIREDKTKNEVWRELKKLGMKNILEVIMYRSYIDRNCNRGFVFVEFPTHDEAAQARTIYHHALLFGERIQIDWSAPLNNVDDEVMKKVKKLFLRNLNVLQDRSELEATIFEVLGSPEVVEKVYKCRDYAFVHFVSRRDAQRALVLLREYYKLSDVEVWWAKPANENKNDGSSPASSSSGSPIKKSKTTVFNPNAEPWVPNKQKPQPQYCAYCSSFLPEAEMFQSSRRIIQALNM